MPWFGLEGIGLSGFQLAKLGSHEFGSDVGPVWLIWLIPLMAGITLLVSIQRMNNRVWGFFTGWTPVVVLGYAFIKITGNDGERGMRNAFEFFRHALAIGSYLTLGTGIAIIIASAQSAPSNPPESRPSSSSQNKLSELERLARLRDSGVLTQEEFEAQKKLLLG